MTPDQIRQIAVEYARPLCGDKDYFDMGNMEMPAKDAYDSAYSIIKWLNKHYCVVERSKVEALEAEIHCAIMDAHNDDDMQMVAHEVLDVMPRRFAAVFGSETFDKKEND